MENHKNGYEVKQNGKDYEVLIDINDEKLIIKCLNKSTGDYFSSKNYELEDLRAMNKYFRVSDSIKEIQTLLNSAIEKVKMGLLEDFTQITIFFYLMLGLDENTIAFILIKEKNILTKSAENESDQTNQRYNNNYVESLENENILMKKEHNILKEEIKKLNKESNELKKQKDMLKEDNDLLRQQNQRLMEFKQKYESSLLGQNQAAIQSQNIKKFPVDGDNMNNRNIVKNYGYQNQIPYNNTGYGNKGKDNLNIRFNNNRFAKYVDAHAIDKILEDIENEINDNIKEDGKNENINEDEKKRKY